MEGSYVDKKCPFTGNVSIRGRIMKAMIIRAGFMKNTVVVRRDYLRFVKKYRRCVPTRAAAPALRIFSLFCYCCCCWWTFLARGATLLTNCTTSPSSSFQIRKAPQKSHCALLARVRERQGRRYRHGGPMPTIVEND